MNINNRDFSSEFVFKASRSSGSGGQNVNKVSTKVELSFDVANSLLLSEEEKAIIADKLQSHINVDGILKVVCQEERSQLQNKEITVLKFKRLIKLCFTKPKKRIATKPSKAAKAKRLNIKKQLSEKKESRRKTD